MIAAAQGDVVIEIDERPIVKAEVSNNVLTQDMTTFSLLRLSFIDKYSLFASHTMQLHAEMVSFCLSYHIFKDVIYRQIK